MGEKRCCRRRQRSVVGSGEAHEGAGGPRLLDPLPSECALQRDVPPGSIRVDPRGSILGVGVGALLVPRCFQRAGCL